MNNTTNNYKYSFHSERADITVVANTLRDVYNIARLQLKPADQNGPRSMLLEDNNGRSIFVSIVNGAEESIIDKGDRVIWTREVVANV